MEVWMIACLGVQHVCVLLSIGTFVVEPSLEEQSHKFQSDV